jgi:hypothetical protein
MKNYIYFLLLALVVNSCNIVSKLQRVESRIPCIGAVGEDRSTLFKKEFQKVGEPTLSNPIASTLNSRAFDKNSYTKYVNYTQNMGKRPRMAYADSLVKKPRFYTLAITDLVGLKSALNHEKNNGLKNYMATNSDLQLLHEISFVTTLNLEMAFEEAQHFYISETKEGLVLEIHSPMGDTTLQMRSLDVFDFDTASICWTKSQFGNYEVASFLIDGKSCPDKTEKDPHKLDDVASYLKF